MKLKRIDQVVNWRLCIGCGACAYACPQENIVLKDITSEGIRPTLDPAKCKDCGECIKVCPGYEIIQTTQDSPGSIAELRVGWGPILELWEGYATDPDLRFHGSSGGLASALALYCMEKEGMHGTLHIGADDQVPLKNKTVFSNSRTDILARSSSRYSPASPCDSLNKIEQSLAPCVFIGKPCDVTGLRKAQFLKPSLDKKIGVALGIFCAGTPSTQGVLDLVSKLGFEPSTVEELRFRGKGWPGKFSIKIKGEEKAREVLTYMESWNFLQKYRPYRCYLCPDGTSEFADISCGDPWYREINADEQGYSLVLVRTEKGRKILRGAVESGYVSLKGCSPGILELSQKNLLAKRRAIWGRTTAMRLFLIPAPNLKGFSLFNNWIQLTLDQKIRSFLGTVRRIILRGYFKSSKTSHLH